MKNFHSQESGRSMVEMLGVLAIIGVLSVGGIAGYSQAMSKFKVTKTTDQIQTMITNIRTLFSTQRTYKGVEDEKIMYSTGIFTDEICPEGGDKCTTPINPFGGKITTGTLEFNSAKDKMFYIAYDGLPADACVRLLTQSWGDASSGLYAVQAGSTGFTAPSSVPTTSTSGSIHLAQDATDPDTSVPWSIAKASTGCGTSGSTSYMVLYFR